MTPLDYDCSHVERHGFHCGAEPGQPCVEIDRAGDWHWVPGFHSERVAAVEDAPPALLRPLTPAEGKVIALLAGGHNRESIANSLGITIFTVQKHQQHIGEKLGISSALEIVVWFYRTYYQPRVIEFKPAQRIPEL